MNRQKKKSICIVFLVTLMVTGIAVSSFAQTAENKAFNSTAWKRAKSTDFGMRQNMVNQVSSWAINKQEAEIRDVLGEPDSSGVGGVLGVEWQPADGSKAWNYNITPSDNKSHLGNAVRIYIKDGRVIRSKTITIGCD